MGIISGPTNAPFKLDSATLATALADPSAASAIQGAVAGAPTAAAPVDGDFTAIFQGGTLKKVLHKLLTALWMNGLGGEVARTLSSHLSDRRFSVKTFGAKGDLQAGTGTIASGSSALTVGGQTFITSGTATVGQKVIVTLDSGAFFISTISAIPSNAQLTLGTTAPSAATTKAVWWGTDDTASIMAAINWAWNGGGVIGSVEVPPGAYLVSDTNADGYGIIVPDGVQFVGHGYASCLHCFTAIRVWQYNGLPGGTWRKGFARDFHVDGHDVATAGVHFYSGAYYGASNIIAHNCTRPVVFDGCQNCHFLNIQGKDGTENLVILNGAGSIVLEGCGTDGAFTRQILSDNDSTYPGYAGRLSQGGFAYDDNTACIIRAGVFERTKTGGSLSEGIKIVRGSDWILDGVNFSGSPTNALVEYGAAGTQLVMRTPFLYHGNQTVDVAHFLGFNAVITEPTVSAAAGDMFQIGNFGTVVRANTSVGAGKVIVKHSSGSVFSAMQQINHMYYQTGGATAARPGATATTNSLLRRWNYDIHNWETWDPNNSIWRVEGHSVNQVSGTAAGGGSYTPDLSLGRHFNVSVTGTSGTTSTINLPSNASPGDRFTVLITQDATGGKIIAWAAGYRIVWSDTGNTASKWSSVNFMMTSTTIPLMIGGQSPYF